MISYIKNPKHIDPVNECTTNKDRKSNTFSSIQLFNNLLTTLHVIKECLIYFCCLVLSVLHPKAWYQKTVLPTSARVGLGYYYATSAKQLHIPAPVEGLEETKQLYLPVLVALAYIYM